MELRELVKKWRDLADSGDCCAKEAQRLNYAPEQIEKHRSNHRVLTKCADELETALSASQDGETPRDPSRCSLCDGSRYTLDRERTKFGVCTFVNCPNPTYDYDREQKAPAAAPSETPLRIIERMEMVADIGVMVGSTVVKDFAKELRAALRAAKDLQQR